MKNLTFLVFILFFSCAKNDQEDSLRKELEILKKDHTELVNELNYIKENYLEPFKLYEENVLNELKTSPDTIILNYTKLIEKYPNSFWKHESEKRMENIKNRKHLWTKESGWNLNSKNYIPKPMSVIKPIICPGC
ncbi:hypothetical protein H2O64_14360 [Kordia sp. YSTF-M3]|uniref:Lipoprotein n=1 Tax=Kordia aestuariivivens TaxID=2759037 RepID=A0ABR7QBF3_9FLAO|nr:hypothetical protein [Kordia aestuariivivens]MBC8755857.1 hypothetical protein [Kordia aestuariivivens]